MSVNNKVTVGTFRKRKAAGEKISMLTVYDAPGAAICHSAGVDSLLVGDSLAMTRLQEHAPAHHGGGAAPRQSRAARRARCIRDFRYAVHELSGQR